MKDIILSVVFITYNHEKYVEKALRSVCEQETDFDYEVVVGEDCSTDSTREILRRVAEEYPDKVRLLFREKNFGRPTLNVYNTTIECRGRYLAYLEGDDYWTDMHKLQKQVDYLEEHPEYIACTHACMMIDEKGERIEDEKLLEIGSLYNWSGDFTYDDFKKSGKWPGHYATLVSRNIYPQKKYDYTILYRAHDFVDDALILLFLLIQGKIYRMDETMSAWRYVKKPSGTNWNSLAMKRDLIKDDCYLNTTMTKWVEEAVGLTDHAAIRCKKDYLTALNLFLHKPDKDNYRFLKDMFEYNIVHVVRKDKRTNLACYSALSVFKRLMEGKRK
ncbi:MAG: glycosyltransferase [Lachnospiraceae bacterium]|nr:glycosyltransferase [Lachnospiraceae bacterium]